MAMEFLPDGRLAMVFLQGQRRQTIRLSYRVEGGELVTDQPSEPREQRSRFSFVGSDLVLDFDGEKTRLSRASTG